MVGGLLKYRLFWLIASAALLFYFDYKTIASFVFISSILDLSIEQELGNNKIKEFRDEEE